MSASQRLDVPGTNVDDAPPLDRAQPPTSFFDANQLHSDVWEPLRNVAVGLFFFLALSSFALPSIVALWLFSYPWNPSSAVLAAARFLETDDHILSPFVDYWPVIPGLGAGLAISYPERRKKIIALIFFIMVVVVVSSSLALYQKSYFSTDDMRTLVASVLSHLDVAELPETLHRLTALIERSRDVAIAFLSALVGAAVGGAQQRSA